MREAAEPLDDLAMALGVDQLLLRPRPVGPLGVFRHAPEQGAAALLVGEVLAVLERQIEEPPPRERYLGVEAAGERAVADGACQGIPWIHGRTRARFCDRLPPRWMSAKSLRTPTRTSSG